MASANDPPPGDEPAAVTQTVPFIPSEIETKLIRALEDGQAPLPVLPKGDEPVAARVREAMKGLSRGLRRYEVQAARALRRGETAARISEIAADLLGEPCEDAELAGLVQVLGELQLWRVLDRIPDSARIDEALTLVRRYSAPTGAEMAAAWNLPHDVVRACVDGTLTGAPVAARLGRASAALVDAVETALDGGTPTWDAAAVAQLGVDSDSAGLIVREAAAVLRAR